MYHHFQSIFDHFMNHFSHAESTNKTKICLYMQPSLDCQLSMFQYLHINHECRYPWHVVKRKAKSNTGPEFLEQNFFTILLKLFLRSWSYLNAVLAQMVTSYEMNCSKVARPDILTSFIKYKEMLFNETSKLPHLFWKSRDPNWDKQWNLGKQGSWQLQIV